MTDKHLKFDPSQFGDPVAMQTDWTYTTKGIIAGTDFQTHKLAKVDSSRLEFRATAVALLFYLLFLVGGVVAFFTILYKLFLSGGFSFITGKIVRIIIAVVITPLFAIIELISWGMFYSGTTPIVFDNLSGLFWKGRKTPNEVFSENPLTEFAKLKDIHALQLISKYFRGGRSSYYCYELNLVLQNGKRINVVAHGNEDKLREDTGTLSTFLGKPVWDAIKD